MRDSTREREGERRISLVKDQSLWSSKLREQKKGTLSCPSANVRSLTVWVIVDLPVPASQFSQKTGDWLKSLTQDSISLGSLSCPFETATAFAVTMFCSLCVTTVVQHR